MNNTSPTSRNKREGTYKGKKCNKHFRSARKYNRAKRTFDMILAEHINNVITENFKKRFNNVINNALFRSFIEFTNCLILAADSARQFANHASQDLTAHQSNQNTTAS